MISTVVSIPGYQVSEELYNGSRTLVYRAVREIDSLRVIIKLLKNPYPSFSELLWFRNQYTITKNLYYPGIIQTYSLEPYQNGYTLVMEDFGAISLKDYFANNNHDASLQEFLQIAISLCDTLDILHRQRISHKDIKPANILINPQTKQVKLIDFSIASLLPRETQTLISPNVLEGTLAYLSPEQTGRMNRGIDYRTDFYSLGVTFYELLTGKLPFESNDPMELVHCHIAKQVPVLAGSKEIPQVISDIVIKLMAKNAEDRYQGALGLKHDLEKCLAHIKETGKIENFEIGKRDIYDSFIIPDKLYGRETEVETLFQAFERISMGTTEMMLVTGFSGIGKTAVVNEVHKPIVRQRGYFIKGKFDQFNRNIPFSAFVQAFRELMRQLLTESDAQIQQWKSKILEAVGENGQVIIEVIPELSIIIGQQPPTAELSGTAAQNRFNLLFQKFVQIFTTKEHPLVIFLDDLQWADSASLKLMQLLMADTGYFFLIGAYRDHEMALDSSRGNLSAVPHGENHASCDPWEDPKTALAPEDRTASPTQCLVNPAHPLMLTLNEIQKTAATINTITLAPLNQGKVNELVADTLKCTEKLALPLSQLITQKTQGNPFFTTQFLKALHQDGLIKFNFESGCWQCDIAQVTQRSLTSDVVEFMTLQLQKLPESTQEILKLAACIGHQFDLETLAIVSEKSEIETAMDLWTALQESLILPQSEVYKFYQGEDNRQLGLGNNTTKQLAQYNFLHDRVQQAAYSLIPEDQKQATHLKLGQLLLKNTPVIEREEKIFEIVNQLNYGVELITQSNERQELAQLNIVAGRKAKASTAYGAAGEYATLGISLLNIDCWQNQYELALGLHELAAEAAYLSGNFDQMAKPIETVIQNAKIVFDEVKVYEVKILSEIAQGNSCQAIKVALKILNALGVTLPEAPTSEEIQQAVTQTHASLTSQLILGLVDSPLTTDDRILAIMRLLSSVISSAYVAAPGLLVLIVCKQVNLSIEYGSSELSSFVYAIYGLILCGQNLDFALGYQLGQLALRLAEKFQSKQIQARTLQVVSTMLQPWKQHFRETLSHLQNAYQIGITSGELEYAGYAATNYCRYAYLAGYPLKELKQEISAYIDFFTQRKQIHPANHLLIILQAAQCFTDSVFRAENLPLQIHDEKQKTQLLETSDRHGLFNIYFNELCMNYLFQNFHPALESADLAEGYLDGVTGIAVVGVFYFYDSLVRLSMLPKLENTDRDQLFEKVRTNQLKMRDWAERAQMNFLHKFYLVEAERHRVMGEKTEAIDLYDRAISLAKENQFLNEEALANELAAKFYLDWGKEKVAAGYMQEAYYCYARWGAKAKISNLEKRYPELLKPILQQQPLNLNPLETITFRGTSLSTRILTTGSTSIDDTLDLATVLKASQVLSSEIKLEDLMSTLMKVVMENAGADKCALMLFKGNSLTLEATATSKEANAKIHRTLLQSILIESSPEIPVSIINYVSRTNETLVIDDAMAQKSLASDSYFLQQQPRSLLCTPINNQGKLIGILYLENNLTTGAFTRDRLQVIKLLTTQAAISLENSLLYHKLEDYSHTLEQKVSERTQELKQKTTQIESTLEKLYATQAQLIQAEKMSGLGQLVAGIAHEINNPINFIYGNLLPAREYFTSLIELNNLYHENYPQPVPEIEEKIADMELDFLVNDLQSLLESMKVGADRIRNIVLSLRNFSRLDESEIKPVNLHEGIDSTLLILQHRLKNSSKNTGISVIKEYSQIPLVKCSPSTLNQVFMHILSNAIDALQGLDINHKPTIRIRTELQDQKYVSIRIIDNGMGMSESVRNKIFEPFFTTKPVGHGTGLGLSISYSIVVLQHGGQLNCISAPGQGTEFVITIPM